MSDPYLILHRVRGQPAFDIAEKMTCAICQGSSRLGNGPYCDECNQEGHWWIIPTSGHRAYPYEQWPMFSMWHHTTLGNYVPALVEPLTDDWPDHYACNDRPTASTAEHKSFAKGLLEKLGLVRPTKVERRF